MPQRPTVAYKLFRVRTDGSISSLFINKQARLPIGQWLEAEAHPTPGYEFRPGWHACPTPNAPHLSTKGRAWFKVYLLDVTRHTRPDCF